MSVYAQTPLVRFCSGFCTTSCTMNPQHRDMSICRGFVVDSTTNPRQINSRSKKCSLGVHFALISCSVAADANKIQLQVNAADDIRSCLFAMMQRKVDQK